MNDGDVKDNFEKFEKALSKAIPGFNKNKDIDADIVKDIAMKNGIEIYEVEKTAKELKKSNMLGNAYMGLTAISLLGGPIAVGYVILALIFLITDKHGVGIKQRFISNLDSVKADGDFDNYFKAFIITIVSAISIIGIPVAIIGILVMTYYNIKILVKMAVRDKGNTLVIGNK